MNDEPDDMTDEDPWEAAVARLAASAQVRLLLQIIERRAMINRLRATRVGWPEIATLLCEFGIKIGPGTLRNYSSRIALAVRELEAVGNGTVVPASDAQIYELCCQRARPGHGRSAPDQRSGVPRVAPSRRPSGHQPFAGAASPRTPVIRDPDEGL
jgi:hypothetical protein